MLCQVTCQLTWHSMTCCSASFRMDDAIPADSYPPTSAGEMAELKRARELGEASMSMQSKMNTGI